MKLTSPIHTYTLYHTLCVYGGGAHSQRPTPTYLRHVAAQPEHADHAQARNADRKQRCNGGLQRVM